jgi:hypothetical protein
MLKKLIFGFAIATLAFGADAQTLTTPQPSTAQTIKQNFGLGTIELSYSRPNMRG